MKHLFLIFSILVFVACGNKSDKINRSIIGMRFQHFKQIKELSTYTKISDTVISHKITTDNPTHRILHLSNQVNNAIIFNSISLDSVENKIYEILDTLFISHSNKLEFVTIGYCSINNGNDENIIALVEKTDSLKIQKIKKIWRANINSQKIETINGFSNIECFNEFFEEKYSL
ncbi:hypothetical protein APS56_15000 [Pseudalgibacter alginicilyticus]|uniref:Lipoprotein n=1 Tax=Pseudalgibacter alginicilyticus TaxID=1736674 RepID=A0A0N7HYW2_9FLAO|nr:hypothetical protein [Pseudalgibacter alginicilyticus]ALJ06366.1 hypothetical protein APS56_15000 [Pseudalgibacter alginicilyticus]